MKTRFSFILLLALALMLGGCSHFSRQARQQRAYEKYVRRSSITRVRQSMKVRSSSKMQLPPAAQPSDPMITTATGPESVSAGSE